MKAAIKLGRTPYWFDGEVFTVGRGAGEYTRLWRHRGAVPPSMAGTRQAMPRPPVRHRPDDDGRHDVGHQARMDDLARVIDELVVIRSGNLYRTIITHNWPSGAAFIDELERWAGLEVGGSRLRQRVWEFGHLLTMGQKTGTRKAL